MVFECLTPLSAIFISWSHLFVQETTEPAENQRPAASH
jgi:hypothetical protein